MFRDLIQGNNWDKKASNVLWKTMIFVSVPIIYIVGTSLYIHVYSKLAIDGKKTCGFDWIIITIHFRGLTSK